MTAPIRRRLDALECLKEAEAQRPLLVITRYDREPIGMEMPPPLPHVLRLPGESVDALAARASTRIPGVTPVLLFAKYDDDGAAER